MHLLKKKYLEFTNENDCLNAKVKCLEIENKRLHDEIMPFKENQSIVFEHENSHVNNLTKENETFQKKSNELNDIVLKFINGQRKL